MSTSHRAWRHVGVRSLLALALALTLADDSTAQITAATISGTIKDETGGILPGVDVVARNVGTGLSRAVVTNSNGSFTLPGLPPGTYEVRATIQGFTWAALSGSSITMTRKNVAEILDHHVTFELEAIDRMYLTRTPRRCRRVLGSCTS